MPPFAYRIDWNTNCALGAVPAYEVVGNEFTEGFEPDRTPLPTIDPDVCVPCPPPIAWSSSQVPRSFSAYPLMTRIGLAAWPTRPKSQCMLSAVVMSPVESP